MVVQLDAIQLIRRHVIVATESERTGERAIGRAGAKTLDFYIFIDAIKYTAQIALLRTRTQWLKSS